MIISFVAKCRAEKKEDKVDTDGTIEELQKTSPFLSMRERDAFIKIRSPRNLIDNPYKDIRLPFKNYFSPKERIVTT